MTGKPRRTRAHGWAWVYGVVFGPGSRPVPESTDDTETDSGEADDRAADPDDRGSTDR